MRYKKNPYLIWVFLLGLFITGVTVAGTSEVATPQQQWIYSSLQELHHAGYLQNYPDDWVQSGNTLSRLEIAYYIKQILTVTLKDNDKNLLPSTVVHTLQNLIVEFRDELAALGIKITDINKISPNLVSIEPSNLDPEEYQDLDVILKERKNETKILKQEPYYYLGQYFQSWQRKSFVFIPNAYVNPNDLPILEGNVSNINIVYPKNIGDSHSFLVIHGNLPVQESNSVSGYYLFPIENETGLAKEQFDDNILSLLDEVNQIQQIEFLQRVEGKVSLSGYSRKETDLQSRVFLGSINKGMKVGGLLLFSQNPPKMNDFQSNDFGLPFYSLSQAKSSTAEDLDKITGRSLESLLINIYGSKSITPQASIYGGLDLLYRDSESVALFENYWPSEVKASAGITYQMNDYWTLLTYQSFVNSQVETGILSTTSIGLEYDNWATFWLAYQLLDFNDPVVTGALTFRF